MFLCMLVRKKEKKNIAIRKGRREGKLEKMVLRKVHNSSL